MYESTIQGERESGGAPRGSIGVSPSNEYASRRGYLQGLSFIWWGVNSVTMGGESHKGIPS
uniref:Uncharacterized protein n=1 Tax=Amphimedon queenslandica TaxID=400682 RepID=A0A1X7V330_AMPQE